MGAAHWHLLLTHVQVVGAVFGFLLLVVAVLTANQAIRRLSLGALVLVALLALPTYFTGEPAEEAVERLPGVSEPIIDRHQTAATASFAAVEVLGGLALLALALGWRRRGVPTWVVAGLLVVTGVTAGLLGWTANLGGQIRHPEIRAAGTPAPPGPEVRTEGRGQEAD